jgi:hypothetical protein
MTENNNIQNPSAYIAIKSNDLIHPTYSLRLKGQRELYNSIREGDWFFVINNNAALIAIGRLYRLRSDLEGSTLHFDKYLALENSMSLSGTPISPPNNGHIGRLEWVLFAETLPSLTSQTVADIPLIEDPVYVRELLQQAVVDDLLGPANGPLEQIFDMSVRDRYLVGRLAPINAQEKSDPLGVDGSADDDDEPDDLLVKAQAEAPNSSKTNMKPDSESNEEVDAADNQSLIPSSMGMTFCVAGNIQQIDVEARWGSYERFYDHEMYKTKKDPDTGEETQGNKVKVWQRIPRGKIIGLTLDDGVINPTSVDPEQPEIVLQGTVRKPNINGDRLVTLFLVNTLEEPDENKDTHWLFQPEIIVRAKSDNETAIFRRRPVIYSDQADMERESLDMIYRKQVEFAVGHGVAVHAEVSEKNLELATEIKTVVLPEYEVPVTQVPGTEEHDRPVLKKIVQEGYLDMTRLAEMDRPTLISSLTLMTDDYANWIQDQLARVGHDVIGHDDAAKRAMFNCSEIHQRLQEGINLLADESQPEALEAFRFANRAMAKQRVRSIYAQNKRQGKKVTVEEFDIPKNRSWRSFQLAFLLLSIPALADPEHQDRTEPAEAFADLLWFPTGGGKTEAYLGVAAFAMAIRRFQGDMGDYDASRGLAVIMRYTLRLLTLQQFQRATALICAMEVLRRDALEKGDLSLGEQPFTIGLWVGNKVTPGTTQDSHTAIKDIRNPEKYNAGSSSPAQLTSCPWCGSDINPGVDIEVNTSKLQTSIYCGDKKGRCEFSKAKTVSLPHPGLPAVVVDQELYHRPPSMMIATVDKFAMMAWRGETRTLFGKATSECERHGLLWPDAECSGTHTKTAKLSATKVKSIKPIRPPDLIIQDEFHLISGPLGTMVGLYETAVDELTTWSLNGKAIKPKIIASTATVRKADAQIQGVFNRRVAIFPPSGLDVEDNFFSVQRTIKQHYGRRYMGVCSPGSARPAVLIRVYTAFLTASQALFERFGKVADPYMTSVGYFNSLRELGGMKRLAEDDVQTRSYRVGMSLVDRPGLTQRGVNNIRELTSRISSQEIPKYLDQLEVPFRADFNKNEKRFISEWEEGESRAIDVVLATNMLSVGVDVNRLGVMAVNGQPKSTAEYIQATSRVGRSFPGLVCTVLTWARPRDLSHYETFEHYHATFYQHVEAQSVTPFSPRAMDRGLTGAMLSLMRLSNDELNPNDGAAQLEKTTDQRAYEATNLITERVSLVADSLDASKLAEKHIKSRIDSWVEKNEQPGRTMAYEKKGQGSDLKLALIYPPGINQWDSFTVPMSMREVEPGVKLQMSSKMMNSGPSWKAKVKKKDSNEDE